MDKARRERIDQTIRKLNSLPPLLRLWCANQMSDYLDGLPNKIDGSRSETFEEWRSKLPTELVRSYEAEAVGA